MDHWYSIKASRKTAELSIYGEIGAYGVSANNFITGLNALKGFSQINLDISSEGGSVQDGIAIYNALKTHPAKVHVYITGWALSMGSFIAMAGDKVYMAENALMMIHNAWSTANGDAKELRKSADILEKATESLVNGYVSKTGKTPPQIIELLDAETWFTAQEALQHGFIDEISAPVKMAAQFNFNKFNPPENLKGLIMPDTNVSNSNTNNDSNISAAAILAADSKRRSDIRAEFKPFMHHEGMPELMATLENDTNCSVEAANLKILAKLAEGATPIQGRYTVDPFVTDRSKDFKAAAIDVLLSRAGIQNIDPSPMARDIKNMSVVGMAEQFLKMQGKSTSNMGNMDIIKNAQTYSDFPLLLSNTLGKALLMGYDNEPSTHMIWTGEKEVRDFKPQSMIALSEAPDMLEVIEGGEYKHGSFGESAESFSIKTYGRIFSITRQALINDDLSAFTNLPAAFGASSKRLEADLVYAKLLSSTNMSDGNPLFHTSHGNLAASGAALSITSLASARAAMRKQKGINGIQYIDPVPRFLIVPVALETVAEQLIASLVDPSKSNDTTNVQWVRSLTVVADPRLDDDSEVSWYLAASPSQIDGIVRAYLAGEQRPYYEVNDEFERDVTAVKARLDFAVGTIDFRAMYKNPGA
jgi:ATP-dependent Clp endopeptidase proteolytic subunit ClpP